MREIELRIVMEKVLGTLEFHRLGKGTIRHYKHYLDHLMEIAEECHSVFYDASIGRRFIQEISSSRRTGRFDHKRHCFCLRCVQMVESYLATGAVDLSGCHSKAVCPIKSPILEKSRNDFEHHLEKAGLSENSLDGYMRLVLHFINFMERKGYRGPKDIRKGDGVLFISIMCQEHYRPTSLGGHLPGLRQFFDFIKRPELKEELPRRLPKKKDILKIYSDDEVERIFDHVANAENLTLRDRCICMLAFETGLRAVDICNLRLGDIDWEKDTISIIQVKTKRPLTLPLRESYGNFLAEYILKERPRTDSDFVFLRSIAPFEPLKTHSAVYRILNSIIKNAGIDKRDRIAGTRMTRHTMGSRMLRKGVPLSVVSQSLGHASLDSTMRYISLDEERLAGLTLPLPKGGRCNG